MSRLYRFLTIFLFLSFVLIGYFFVRMNVSPVEVWLGFSFPSRPVGQWLLAAFVIGGVFGLLIGISLFKRIKMRMKVLLLESSIKKLKDENVRLKKASIKGFVEE